MRIEYEKSYVAFLDVLGFKSLVLNNSMDKFNLYFDIINNVIDYLKKIPLKSKIGYIVISDSVILSIPQSDNQEDMINN